MGSSDCSSFVFLELIKHTMEPGETKNKPRETKQNSSETSPERTDGAENEDIFELDTDADNNERIVKLGEIKEALELPSVLPGLSLGRRGKESTTPPPTPYGTPYIGQMDSLAN